MIVSNQQSRSIPSNLPVFIPVKKALPQLGTQAPDVIAMDSDYLETSDECEQQARRIILEREAVGVGDIYSNMQPTSASAIDKGLI